MLTALAAAVIGLVVKSARDDLRALACCRTLAAMLRCARPLLSLTAARPSTPLAIEAAGKRRVGRLRHKSSDAPRQSEADHATHQWRRLGDHRRTHGEAP